MYNISIRLDEVVMLKKQIPGIGKYAHTEKGFLQLSRPPTSLRKLRP